MSLLLLKKRKKEKTDDGDHEKDARRLASSLNN